MSATGGALGVALGRGDALARGVALVRGVGVAVAVVRIPATHIGMDEVRFDVDPADGQRVDGGRDQRAGEVGFAMGGIGENGGGDSCGDDGRGEPAGK